MSGTRGPNATTPGRLGLRIDIDTYRGTKLGVPVLCRLLGERRLQASFFFSVGPDNMGRHLRRIVRPAFVRKMIRSRAASLYGWDVLLRGTLWPGPVIGERLAGTIRSVAEAGHEIGLHAWDHHEWQVDLEAMSEGRIAALTRQAAESLERITGSFPVSSAAAGWRYDGRALRAQSVFPFEYQSDCRGDSIFLPELDGRPSNRPQIPVDLPTYDEQVGRGGTTDANYNEGLLARLRPDRTHVLTIHAEVEGIAKAALFADFLDRASEAGWPPVPLGSLLPREAELPVARIVSGEVPGREGPVALQGPILGTAPWRAQRGAPGPSLSRGSPAAP